MNDKYMDTESERTNDQNLVEQAESENDFLYMQVESIERQIAEGINPVKITNNLVNKIKADAIREAADITWVMVMNRPAIMRSDLLAYANKIEKQIK